MKEVQTSVKRFVVCHTFRNCGWIFVVARSDYSRNFRCEFATMSNGFKFPTFRNYRLPSAHRTELFKLDVRNFWFIVNYLAFGKLKRL